MSIDSPVAETIASNVYRLSLGPGGVVNAILIDVDGELTLFDAGFPDSYDAIVAAIESIGYRVGDLRRIVLSHAHLDHFGCTPALREISGAEVLMSRLDADLVASGFLSRSMVIKPGLEEVVAAIMHGADVSVPVPVAPFEVDGYLEPGEAVPGLPDSEIIATPGHCAGQVSVLLHRDGGILLAADVAGNHGELATSMLAEDLALADRSFSALAERDFEIAVFGHGLTLTSGASAAFRDAAGQLAS